MVSPDLLRRYAHFSQLSEEGLQKLAAIADEKVAGPGDMIFADNDPADQLYLILHGEVDLQYELGSGEKRVVDTLVDGELLVWSALVEPYHCTALGVAAKETHLVVFDAAALRELCERDHELGHKLLGQIAKMLAQRLESARVQLAAV